MLIVGRNKDTNPVLRYGDLKKGELFRTVGMQDCILIKGTEQYTYITSCYGKSGESYNNIDGGDRVVRVSLTGEVLVEEGSLTFGDVPFNSLFIDEDGNLCQKYNNNLSHIISVDNGGLCSDRITMTDAPIKKILDITSIKWED